MEKLLDMARRAADQAEIYACDQASDSVTFQDGKLHDIETSFLSGVALRLIKNGRLGFAYTRNIKDRQSLIDHALNSLEGGVEAEFQFPATLSLEALNTYDPGVKELSGADLVDSAQQVVDRLREGIEGEIVAVSYTHRINLRILNTQGVDLRADFSEGGVLCEAIYPGTGSGVGCHQRAKRLEPMPDSELRQLKEIFSLGQRVVAAGSGRMKVLFMPGSLITLLWRLASGLSGRSLYERISPLEGKVGQKVFSEKLTVFDHPQDDRFPQARAFDDEGVATQKQTFIDQGVLQGFYFDLKYGQKMGRRSTGHGYRTGPWGGDPLTVRPNPTLAHLFIQPGESSFWNLVKKMDRGLIVEGALGAHSGNIPNGDYSIGVSPGLYVENGQILGRVKDAMVAGNIYETLKEIVDLGNTLYPSFGGSWAPPILCDGVSVATKG